VGNRSETIWWSLFAAGGVVAGMLIPIVIVITGILVPAGYVTAEGLYTLIHHPLTRLVLAGTISLSLFHAAHRTLFTLIDVGLKPYRSLISFALHGIAIVGTILATYFAIRL